jgi:hypothetical protein
MKPHQCFSRSGWWQTLCGLDAANQGFGWTSVPGNVGCIECKKLIQKGEHLKWTEKHILVSMRVRDRAEQLKPSPTSETCQALVAAGYKPYAKRWVRGKLMEVISLPFVQDGHTKGCGIGLMVREPDDPTTMVEWSIPVVEVRAALQQKRSR